MLPPSVCLSVKRQESGKRMNIVTELKGNYESVIPQKIFSSKTEFRLFEELSQYHNIEYFISRFLMFCKQFAI